jgi:7-cyano-7-deazaguanine synthase
MEIVAVLSGGMDSTCAVYQAIADGHKIRKAVSFDYGSKHNKREHGFAQKTCEKLSINFEKIKLDFSSLKSDLLLSGGEIPEGHYADPSMKKTVVPFRNGIMLSYSAGIAESCGADTIMIGNHFGDHAVYPDCRGEFINPMSMAIKHGTYGGIELYSPFVDVTKTEIARIGEKVGVDWLLTYSCYNGRKLHCGKCGTCVERKEAFRESGIKDRTGYEN